MHPKVIRVKEISTTKGGISETVTEAKQLIDNRIDFSFFVQ